MEHQTEPIYTNKDQTKSAPTVQPLKSQTPKIIQKNLNKRIKEKFIFQNNIKNCHTSINNIVTQILESKPTWLHIYIGMHESQKCMKHHNRVFDLN